MHRSMAASALLTFSLAMANQAVATPSTSGTGQSDDRIEAALRFSFNLRVGSFTMANNVLPRFGPVMDLLSVSPPGEVDNTDIQFPALAEDLGNWRGDDWLP
jgi:hypothetical protein